jgi:hypothetical protein
MGKLIDETGKRYGRLAVMWPAGYRGHFQVIWLCVCDCGNFTRTVGNNLRCGDSQSCGCLRREKIAKKATKHGLAKHLNYNMWRRAKAQAEKEGLPFSIMPDDIVVPDKCPVFGVLLRRSSGPGARSTDCSPTLDKVIPELGYVRGNICVISRRANLVKNDGTAEEHKAIVEYIECRSTSDATK